MRDAAKSLDDVSDHLGEVLRNADALLAEWQGFAAKVRAQVDHEARTIGNVVGAAVDHPNPRGIDDAVARAFGERLGAQLAQLAGELGKLESRTRASARAASDQRSFDRRAWWLLGGGVLLANALLVVSLVRGPAVPPPEAPPAPIVVPAAAATLPDAAAVAEPPTAPPIAPSSATRAVGSAEAPAKPVVKPASPRRR
jgi:hypothetical protein